MQLPSVIFILGAHRSGTSCLATCLEQCGLHVVDLNRTSAGRPSQISGGAEPALPSAAVRRIHDRVLATNRAPWYAPPNRLVVDSLCRQQIHAVAGSLNGSAGPVGVKDPCLLLLLNTWQAAVGHHQMIGTFRHPLAVVESLPQRPNSSMEVLLEMWLHFNRRLMRQHQRHRFPLIEYDLASPTDYMSNVAEAAGRLNLTVDGRHLRCFAADRLRQHPRNPVDLPEQCRQVYRYLQFHARQPYRPLVNAPKWQKDVENNARNTFLQAAHMPPNVEFESA